MKNRFTFALQSLSRRRVVLRHRPLPQPFRHPMR